MNAENETRDALIAQLETEIRVNRKSIAVLMFTATTDQSLDDEGRRSLDNSVLELAQELMDLHKQLEELQ